MNSNYRDDLQAGKEVLVLAAIGFVGFATFSIPSDIIRARNNRQSNQPIFATVLEDVYKTYSGEEQRTATSSGLGVSVPISGDASKMGLVGVGGSTRYSVPVVKSEYNLRVKTDEGRDLVISIFDSESVKKESLDMLISPGTKISFPTGNRGVYSFERDKETDFSSGARVGSKRADRIKILN
jgi:hypothetical protein